MQEACTVVGIWLMLTATGIADDNADEMKRLQGHFERTYANAAGTMFRVVKDVTGDQSVVTSYDDVGNAIEAHTSTFKIEKRGPVRVFSFFNLIVTAGPQKALWNLPRGRTSTGLTAI